jgi:2,4-dienoyl-CoA reductase-like NADH-dependent reductase (Old Yellow Enzyme family)
MEGVPRFHGDFDLVAVCRALLDDPLWVRKVKAGTLDGGTFTRESLGRYP